MVRWVAILAKTCRVGSRPPPDPDDAREVSRGVRRTPSRRSGRVAAVVRRRRRAGQLRCRRAATHPAGVRVSIRIEVVGQPVTPESGRNRCRRRGGCVRPHPVLSERPPGPWHVPGMCGQRRWPRGPACTVTVSDRMRVEVNEPETTDMRQALVETLFAEGNHNCPSCEKSGRSQRCRGDVGLCLVEAFDGACGDIAKGNGLCRWPSCWPRMSRCGLAKR
jgi:hypothetical protein